MSFNLTNLPESWNLVRLDSLCKGDSISYGVVQPGRNIQGGVPIIRVNNFRNNRIDCSDLLRVEPSIAAKYQRTMLEGGEVLITIVGSVGQVAFTNETHRGFNVARAVAVIKPKHTVNSQWIAYCLESPIARQWLLNGANTTVQTTINLKDLRSLQIPVPPAQYVSRVVALLSSIDAKVETIAKQNEVLESIAQTLFKSWFVNFDPVHAKAAGREPEGLSAEIAALFPTEFEESELGLIPKGWGVSRLETQFQVLRGLSYKGSGLCDKAGGGLPMLNLNSILEGGGYKYSGIKYYKGLFKDQHIVTGGDLIVANTEQGHKHLLIGFPAIVPDDIGEAIHSHHTYKLKFKQDASLGVLSAYFLIRTDSVREQIIACANGSTVNMLKPIGLECPKFVLAPAPVSKAFERIVDPMWKTIEMNHRISQTLSEVRDELLPRLISGKIKIEEAEDALADVMPSTEKQVA